MSDRWVWLIPAVFFLTGLLLLYLGLSSRRLARASLGWPSAPGQVVESYVNVSTSQDENAGETSTYTAKVEYVYTVGASEYRSKRVRFGLGSSSDRGLIQGLVDRFPAGSAVEVFYDPERPDRATLDRSGSSGTVLVVLGSALLAASLVTAGMLVLLRGRS